MAGMRARPNAIYHQALRQGLKPSPIAIARASGVQHRTVKRVLAGGHASPETMALIAEALGSTIDELFEYAGDDAVSVRSA